MTNIPDPENSKSLQLHQMANLILTAVLGAAITSTGSFLVQTNNAIIYLSKEMQVIATATNQITNKLEKLEDRLRIQEMKP